MKPPRADREPTASVGAGAPRRLLGLPTATALIVANMIGTGVFTTSGFLLGDLGSRWAVLGVWVAGGLLAALGALSYGALARRIPESGGEYVFLSRTLHPAAGYVAGWISLLVGFSAPIAAAAFGFGQYTKTWFNGCPPQISGTVLVLLFAGVHAAHVQRGARVQNWAVLAKIALLASFVLFGLARVEWPTETMPAAKPLSAFAVALVWVSFSYSGWNAAIYIAGEVAQPERNVPRALWLGTALVTVLYLGLNAVFVFSAPIEALAGKLEIGRIAAQAIGGRMLGEIVTAVIALALITSVSSMLMAGPRVYARMAEDSYLPQWFAATAGPPRGAIALQAAVALAMLWTATYEGLLTYIGFTLSLGTAATVLGLIRVRLREGRRFHVPGWPWVPMLFLAGVLWMTTFAIARRPIESLLGLASIVVPGAVWFWRYRRAATPRVS